MDSSITAAASAIARRAEECARRVASRRSGRDGDLIGLADDVACLASVVAELADQVSPPTEQNGRNVTIAAREHADADDLVKLMSGCGDEWCHDLADLPAPGLAARLHHTLHGAWDDLRLARVARAEAERDAEEQAQWKPRLDEANAQIRKQTDAIVDTRKTLLAAIGVRWVREGTETSGMGLPALTQLVTDRLTAGEVTQDLPDGTPAAETLLEIRGVFGNCDRGACHSLLGPELTDVEAVAKVHESMHEGWKQYTGLAHRVRKALNRIQGAIDS